MVGEERSLMGGLEVGAAEGGCVEALDGEFVRECGL
jgi:hypothetical protein